MRNYFLILILPFVLFACQKSEDDIAQNPGYTSHMDLAYGPDPKQKLDLFVPPAADPDTTLTMVLIHGGGWTGGDKADFSDYIKEFQQRFPSYAFASVNYRLVTQTTNFFPAQENDVTASMEYLKEKASMYKLSGQFILLGASAGGHLALLQAYKHNDVVASKAVVSFFGPTDLVKLYQETDSSLLNGLKGAASVSPELLNRVLAESSPINYVSASAPPTLLLHGDKDSIVPVNQAQLLHAKLDSSGVRNELAVYKGEGHGWLGNNLVDSFNRLEAFLKSLP
jgi:acetyl esterase/lipase